MKKLFIKNRLKIDESGLQDFIFLFGIFVFFTILIIGLFPGGDSGLVLNRDFFIYTIMTIPVIAAIYFIVASFRRSVYNASRYENSSIKYRLALAFVFVAVLPSLIIILASNNFINKAFANIYTDKTNRALEESIILAEEDVNEFMDRFQYDVYSVRNSLDQNLMYLGRGDTAESLKKKFDLKDISIITSGFKRTGKNIVLEMPVPEKDEIVREIMNFLTSLEMRLGIRIDRINISGRDILAGTIIQGDRIIILYREVPSNIISRREFFVSSLADYKKYESIKSFFRSNVGIFMLVLSIFIVLVSIFISVVLSNNITRPVMELVEAVKQLAFGNFSIRLNRKSNDELGILFKAFNQMLLELDNNRKVMFQKQKLEAWREMATKLVHEIKNPLTPIRLSAERMRRRYIERHKDIENIILSGSETIIEEVDAMMVMLKEFTNFARLPEMKQEKTDINRLIENCVNFFSGHENIKFHFKLDDAIPPVYIDKILFRQVITNLVQNAIRAVGVGGNITAVTEPVVLSGVKNLRIHIIDDGKGIGDDEINKIFEPGYSGDGSGTGLGLSIVEMIVFEHSGKITCKSETGKGADFFIDIPLVTGER